MIHLWLLLRFRLDRLFNLSLIFKSGVNKTNKKQMMLWIIYTGFKVKLRDLIIRTLTDWLEFCSAVLLYEINVSTVNDERQKQVYFSLRTSTKHYFMHLDFIWVWFYFSCRDFLMHFCVSVDLLFAVQGLGLWICCCFSDYTDSISALNMNQILITARQNNS